MLSELGVTLRARWATCRGPKRFVKTARRRRQRTAAACFGSLQPGARAFAKRRQTGACGGAGVGVALLRETGSCAKHCFDLDPMRRAKRCHPSRLKDRFCPSMRGKKTVRSVSPFGSDAAVQGSWTVRRVRGWKRRSLAPATARKTAYSRCGRRAVSIFAAVFVPGNPAIARPSAPP